MSCFGKSDGSITTLVAGGTPPYNYRWANSATTPAVDGIPAGYYSVTVTDANSQMTSAEITLTEPRPMELSYYVHKYPNGHNISCFGCDNGMIFIDITGGTPPYQFFWQDGFSDQDRWGLPEGTYKVYVFDINECDVTSEIFKLSAPQRSDWTMEGNSGSDPALNYIGTSDNTDLLFKTDATERLRIKGDGTLMVNSLAGSFEGYVVADEDGNLYKASPGDPPVSIPDAWKTTGNSIGPNNPNYLGTIDLKDLIIKTHNQPRMIVSADFGNVGIGTATPTQKLDISHSEEAGGININQTGENNFTKSEIKFSYQGIEKWAIGNNLENSNSESFFLWYQRNPDQGEHPIYINGQSRKIWMYEQPDNNSNSDYRLYVGGGIAARELKVMTGPFPDFVFDDSYNLQPLCDLEKYIRGNRHLPDIPSSADIEKENGFEVGNMQLKLLQKIEELTLYVIEQQKQIDELKRKIDTSNH
ncbi:MAG: SprB repeat-containing protein [Bacteroidales bacterium]